MAVLRVNATRMELLKLKKRVKMAKKGHKLLKQKRDGLMKAFMEIIHENKRLCEEVEEKMKLAFMKFTIASGLMRPEAMTEAFMLGARKINLEVKKKNVMSVNIPIFALTQEGDTYTYGMQETSPALDEAIKVFTEVFEMLVRLAEIEKSTQLLATEIEKTRRRVNALEYTLIPNLIETVKFIQMKLDEMERSALISVMKIKDVVKG